MVAMITIDERSLWVFLAAMAIAALPVLVLVRMARARLAITDSELVYVGAMGKTVIERSDIRGVVPGSYGLGILRDSDWNTVTVWAIQKAPISGSLGRRTRADRIAEQIEEWANHVREPTDSPGS